MYTMLLACAHEAAQRNKNRGEENGGVWSIVLNTCRECKQESGIESAEACLTFRT